MKNTNDLQPIKSGIIRAWSYDSANQTLSVSFMSDQDTTHLYSPVSPDLMASVFQSGGSVGSKFIKLIRNVRNVRHTIENG